MREKRRVYSWAIRRRAARSVMIHPRLLPYGQVSTPHRHTLTGALSSFILQICCLPNGSVSYFLLETKIKPYERKEGCPARDAGVDGAENAGRARTAARIWHRPADRANQRGPSQRKSRHA